MSLLRWISENPGAFASIISAIIAASIALIVFALTQFFSYRRDRTQFLAPKLEELYLLLNETAEDNVKFFKLVAKCAIQDESALKEFASMDEVDLYGHRRAKKIIMYVRLYFPPLTKIHIRLFRAQQQFNDLIYRLDTDDPPSIPNITSAVESNAHFLRLMEDEIIRNRDKLLSDYVGWKKYVETSQEDLDSRVPRPPGTFENLVIIEEIKSSAD